RGAPWPDRAGDHGRAGCAGGDRRGEEGRRGAPAARGGGRRHHRGRVGPRPGRAQGARRGAGVVRLAGEAIVLADSSVDWVAIHRLNGAAIEGTREEMLALADALMERREYRAVRCAVWWDYDGAVVSSPRNSIHPTVLPPSDAVAL